MKNWFDAGCQSENGRQSVSVKKKRLKRTVIRINVPLSNYDPDEVLFYKSMLFECSPLSRLQTFCQRRFNALLRVYTLAKKQLFA